MKRQNKQTSATALNIKDLLPWMGLALLFITLPYLTTWAMTPPGRRFTATLVNLDDTSVYLSAMRQGAAGYWLFHYTFSPEPIPPALSHLSYMLAGRAFAALNISTTAGFHVLRIAGSLFTMLTFYYWLRMLFPKQQHIQLSAWLLIVFGSGLGWLAITAFHVPFKAIPDLRFPEWSVLASMLGPPHFAIGFGLQTLFFSLILRMTSGSKKLRCALTAATVAFLLGFFYPFNLLVISLTLGIYMLIRSMQARRILWADWIHTAIIALLLLPIPFYYAIWMQKDAIWKQVQISNNVIPPPAPLFVLVGLGLLAPLALLGAYQWIKQRRDSLAPVWAVSNLLAIYLPVPYSARFVLGLAVPVGSLAGFGLETVLLPWLRDTKLYQWLANISSMPYNTLRYGILILSAPSTIMVVSMLTLASRAYADYPLLYYPEPEAQAAEWLAENTTSDALVLAGYETGNYLPRVFSGKVFMGQPFLTVDLKGKFLLWSKFWDEETTPAWRKNFIKEWGITHVYYGFAERKTGAKNIATLPGRIVYKTDDVIIFDVRDAPDSK